MDNYGKNSSRNRRFKFKIPEADLTCWKNHLETNLARLLNEKEITA